MNDFDRPKRGPKQFCRSTKSSKQSTTIWRRARKRGLRKTTLAPIKHTDLFLFQFSVQLSQQLLHKSIYAGATCHWDFTGYYNPDLHSDRYAKKLNRRFWALHNPQITSTFDVRCIISGFTRIFGVVDVESKVNFYHISFKVKVRKNCLKHLIKYII